MTLALTPLRRVTGWNGFIRFRRMAGLFAFFYGTLHFLTYVIADRFAGLDFPDGIVAWSTLRNLTRSVGDDIYKRPFITVGFTAWSTMLPLALTSTSGMIRRLGGRRWNLLHRFVYATATAGVIHYWWLVKADISRPRAYAVVVSVLLGFRAWRRWGPTVVRARPGQGPNLTSTAPATAIVAPSTAALSTPALSTPALSAPAPAAPAPATPGPSSPAHLRAVSTRDE